jgi:hypothetical protein
MATTPPPPEQPAATGTSAGYGAGPGLGRPGTWGVARMPVPGNAEMVVVILAAIALAILAWVADGLTDRDWWTSFTVFIAAYLISRGIAKASRVLEQ